MAERRRLAEGQRVRNEAREADQQAAQSGDHQRQRDLKQQSKDRARQRYLEKKGFA